MSLFYEDLNFNQPIPVESTDRIYYNAIIKNSDGDNTFDLIKYDKIGQSDVITKASDYYLSIVRFQINASSVPLIYFKIAPNQSNANLSPFTFTLTYGVNDYSATVVYVPDNNLTAPTVNPQPENNRYYYVYTYVHMIEMFNTALASAFTTLKTANPGATATTAPYFIYNTTTGRISLICERAGYIESGADPVQIWVNSDLARYFDAMQVYYDTIDNDKTLRFRILDYGNNRLDADLNIDNSAGTLLQFTQEYAQLQNWNDFRDILFLTNTIPVESEKIQFQDNVGNESTLNILTDFSPAIQNAGDQRSIFFYFPSGPYRILNLTSDSFIKRIDFQIKWVDINNVVRDMYLAPNTSCTVKFLFIKKSTYTG